LGSIKEAPAAWAHTLGDNPALKPGRNPLGKLQNIDLSRSSSIQAHWKRNSYKSEDMRPTIVQKKIGRIEKIKNL
jgi:hypothetical protein